MTPTESKTTKTESITPLDYYTEPQPHGDKITLQLMEDKTPKHGSNSPKHWSRHLPQLNKPMKPSNNYVISNKEVDTLRNTSQSLQYLHRKLDSLLTQLQSEHISQPDSTETSDTKPFDRIRKLWTDGKRQQGTPSESSQNNKDIDKEAVPRDLQRIDKGKGTQDQYFDT